MVSFASMNQVRKVFNLDIVCINNLRIEIAIIGDKNLIELHTNLKQSGPDGLSIPSYTKVN